MLHLEPEGFIKLAQDPLYGRYFVANQDIKAGQKILVSTPIASIVDHASKHIVCSKCLTSNSPRNSFKCQECDYSYCSKECMEMDKADHTLECSFKLNGNFPDQGYVSDYFDLLKRILIKATKFPSDPDVQIVYSAVDNFSSFSNEKTKEFYNVALQLEQFCQSIGYKMPDFPTKEFNRIQSRYSVELSPLTASLVSLIAKEECNSFGLYYSTTNKEPRKGYGLAFFPTAIFFNHSCDPNVSYYKSNNQYEFFTVVPVKKGESLYISYLDFSTNTQERKQILKQVFHFDCGCRVCNGAEFQQSKWLCGECKGFMKPEVEQWICTSCKKLN
ncbi:SET and MYND domain-containing protein 3 [Boothiomyces sp. JEL0838]|nr:SET and MYND domain-containing protein 3 [Boothiomyces sp. JEL0838]